MTLKQAIQLKAMIGILGSLYVILGQNESPASTKKALEQHQLVNDFITRLVDGAGSVAAAQVVPRDWPLLTKVADLLHLLTFASIEAPTAGDSGQARRIMDELRAMIAARQAGAQGFIYRGFKIVTNPAVPPGELWIQQSGRAQRMSRDDIDAHHRAMITPFFNDLAG